MRFVSIDLLLPTFQLSFRFAIVEVLRLCVALVEAGVRVVLGDSFLFEQVRI